MRANQIRRLPVVGPEQQLVGILSLADIARAASVASNLAGEPDVSGDNLVATLAGICSTPPPFVPRYRPGAAL